MTRPIADAHAREEALNPQQSFIVQAPAGSGKTALLIQRILKLLALVEQPEEVLAITFTRKAADEMRDRLLQALSLGQQPEPEAAHDKLTWQLAQQLLQRDAEQQWQLAANPSRLRIQTIDSFCASIVRQMPITSGFGAITTTIDDARPLYQEAARNTLKNLPDKVIGEHVARLLRHLDNHLGKIESLLMGMLQRRDQWLGVITGDDPREAIEQGLQQAISDHLFDLLSSTPAAVTDELCALAAFAAINLESNPKNSGLLQPWLSRSTLPDVHPDMLPAWVGLSELCLTKSGTLRKQANVNVGFPPGSDEHKQRLKDLVNTLNDHPQFIALLDQCRHLPATAFSSDQWQLLDSLRVLLVHAVAELHVLFQTQGEVDYTEVQLRALHALGDIDSPSDLALALDYRIQHILIDEFQDTASGQFRLLEKLCAGWQPDDGRSLFVVGDPMQSIYRFRNAEIGLYLQARNTGIAGLYLQPLTLTVNFRSQQGIVQWVNEAFSQIFPAHTDPGIGSVKYSPSTAYHDPTGPALQICPYLGRDDAAEAAQMLDIIKTTLAKDDLHTIAILVRSRSQLRAISHALKVADIAYQALDVLPLATLQVVKDCRSLTRALLHPGDRLAWLSLLRAPWCGLSDADLLIIASDSQQEILTQLQNPKIRDTLSPDGNLAATRVNTVLTLALDNQRRTSLRLWIEGCWLALGGAACLGDALQAEAVRTYLDLLDSHDVGSSLVDFGEFDYALEKLYAPPDPAASDRLQLMTIHKAKGLQFGTVILPGLGCKTRSEDKRLLEWLERPNHEGGIDLLMAPIHALHDSNDAIYNYLRDTEKQKVAQERNRLLYVATTRAEQKLVLLGHVGWNDKKACINNPSAGSLLEALWPVLADHFTSLSPASNTIDVPAAGTTRPTYRLPGDWYLPKLAAHPAMLNTAMTMPTNESASIEFSWAGQTARHVGTLVHRYLEQISNEDIRQWSATTIQHRQPAILQGLSNLGVTDAERPGAAAKVMQALTQTLTDERGQWILQPHEDCASELSLTTTHNGEFRQYIIDRTFVDAEGTRWIIDYKTGGHEGSDLDTFLAQEKERYRTQLGNYADIYAQLDDRPIRLGLYFPMVSAWIEWQAS